MLYILASILSFGVGFGLMDYTDHKSLTAERESVMVGAGVSAVCAGILFCVLGIMYMAKGVW